MPDHEDRAVATYTNPVYPRSFPDPFVLKFRGEYFAYCTGFGPDGRVFPILRSDDLVKWTEVGTAMGPLPESPPYYWAPEVTYDNGKFYLYYSVGNETLMDIRVAISERPDGDFVDTGRRLTREEFAIDPHVFIDDDGEKYLFYATDFLSHTHIGTGTVVDRMIDWFTLAGNPRPVTRARFDWQVYDPKRMEKGGVRWHTVEGPTVIRRKDRYYEMFSGGNWQNTTYGVSFAMADSVDRPDEWQQFCDGDRILPILRTMPGIVGPGHNSVVRGPNNRELYCVYHRWTDAGRVMAIDRMDFSGNRIFIVGPTDAPEPAPFRPRVRERFSDAGIAKELATSGDWSLQTGEIVSDARGASRIRVTIPDSFLIEITAACIGDLNADGKFGVTFLTANATAVLAFNPAANSAILTDVGGGSTSVNDLPDGLDWNALHTLRICVDHRWIKATLDAYIVCLDRFLDEPVTGFEIFSENQPVSISAIDLTEGFEELFTSDAPLNENGWRIQTTGAYEIADGQLIFDSDDEYVIRKGAPLVSFEYAVNFRVLDPDPTRGEFGIVLKDDAATVLKLSIDPAGSVIKVVGRSEISLPLSGESPLSEYRQLRIIKSGGGAICYLDGSLLADVAVPETRTRPEVFCRGVRTALEMIRLTSI